MPVLPEGYVRLVIFNRYLFTSVRFGAAHLCFASKQFRLAKIEFMLQTQKLGAQTVAQLFRRILSGKLACLRC